MRVNLFTENTPHFFGFERHISFGQLRIIQGCEGALLPIGPGVVVHERLVFSVELVPLFGQGFCQCLELLHLHLLAVGPERLANVDQKPSSRPLPYQDAILFQILD